MLTPQEEVVTWLHTQKDWLQEGASKILTQDEISDADIDTLVILLKSEAGQTVTTTRTFPGLTTTTTPTTLSLDAISEVKGIDSLAPRNRLAFGTDNLTVIYGNNGSGKSGYTRILKRLKAEDPSIVSVKLRKQKAHLDGFITNIQTSYSKTNQEACDEIVALKNTALTKRQIAIEVNSSQGNLFKLEGVGSETWRALWEAARRYSTEEAYKGDEFPKIEDAKCVFCHQDLDADAKIRMQGFDTFVKSTVEANVINAEKAFQDTITNLSARPNIEAIKSIVELSAINPEEWEAKLDVIWTELETKITELKATDGSTEIVGLVISEEIAVLTTMSEGYETLAKQYNEDALKFDRVKAQSDFLELKTLEWTSQQRDSILNKRACM